ncbi:hypothetical protein E1A91_A13G111700v1 [Gossypium mustelinum]|uniref:Uncharacterized protein n=1 Tax=Gossypium mustelinum TaxID=34275 RepID=A0A5D2WHB3_GOSMU|nr:hypothetical protein E1A91_A13G111700v1 [Gossypium mustelinum]
MMPLGPSNFDSQRRGQRSMADLQGSVDVEERRCTCDVARPLMKAAARGY